MTDLNLRSTNPHQQFCKLTFNLILAKKCQDIFSDKFLLDIKKEHSKCTFQYKFPRSLPVHQSFYQPLPDQENKCIRIYTYIIMIKKKQY